MINTMKFGDFNAVIAFDPEIEVFRGEFVGLNGGADFYAKDIDGLRKEGQTSLDMFLAMCEEDGVEPRKSYSGKFVVRVEPELHEQITELAAAEQKSLNQWVNDTLANQIQ